VLKLDLQPLTLGHVLLLVECESVFVTGGNSDDPLGELALAVFICSQDSDKARAGLGAWWARRFFKLWAWFCRRMDYQAEAERFSEWFAEQIDGPKTEETKEARKMGTPWHINLLATLVGEVGVSIEEAEAMPVRKARQLICALGEARGQCKVVSEEDVNFLTAVDFWRDERRRLGMTFDEYVEHKRQEARN
jgi:hypothetical protein